MVNKITLSYFSFFLLNNLVWLWWALTPERESFRLTQVVPKVGTELRHKPQLTFSFNRPLQLDEEGRPPLPRMEPPLAGLWRWSEEDNILHFEADHKPPPATDIRIFFDHNEMRSDTGLKLEGERTALAQSGTKTHRGLGTGR